MMKHWLDPHSRGVYEHPAAAPPLPRPHTANDLGTRLARVEEHLQWGAHDRSRSELESRERARELGAAIVAMREDLEESRSEIMALVRPLIEAHSMSRQRLKIYQTLGIWGLRFVKSILIAGLVFGTVLNRISPEKAEVLGKLLGLPG